MNRSRHELFLVGLILALTLALRLGAFLFVYATQPAAILTPDSLSYERPARALLQLGRFVTGPEHPTTPELTRTPGYPLYIAGHYLLFGYSLEPVILTQILLSIGSIGLTYLVARKLLGPRAALVGALLLALDPTSFLYSQLLLTETLFTFFVLLWVYVGLFLVAGGGKSKPLLLAFGFLLAVATLIRPIQYYLLPPVLVSLALFLWKGGGGFKCMMVSLGLVLVPWLVLVGGWQARNDRVAGCADLSSIKNYNLLWYRGAAVVAVRDGISFEAAQQKLKTSLPDVSGWPAAAQSRFYQTEGARLIRQHPRAYLKIMFNGARHLLLDPAGSALRGYLGLRIGNTGPVGDLFRMPFRKYLKQWPWIRPVLFVEYIFDYYLFPLIFYIGVILGLALAWNSRRKNLASHLLIWGTVLYSIAVSAGPEAYSRFRVPLTPLMAIYAGAGWAWVFPYLRLSGRLMGRPSQLNLKADAHQPENGNKQ